MKGFFLKIGKQEHIEDMYENEYLFFNTLRSFRATEKDDSGRTDPREANTLNTQLTYLEIITSKGTKIKLSEISQKFNGQYNEHPTEIPYNICSLYTLEIEEDLNIKPVDKQVLNLGTRTLLIYNLEAFFNALDSSLSHLGIEYSRKPVIYYDHRTFEGNLTLHHKNQEFSFQNEYRILLQTPGTEVMKIPIPGLKTFSALGESKTLNTIKLVPREEDGI
ncbi:hypothetical protein [Marinoscillum sp.]|uniref:hypothetical protein n=1 Tax=Marinoscillum sp. TaxID=2024838 RepID=UPI003BAA3979